MMTTPRVTEIPPAMAAVEPDPFIDAGPRAATGRRRFSEGVARQRRTELARRMIRTRAAQRPYG